MKSLNKHQSAKQANVEENEELLFIKEECDKASLLCNQVLQSRLLLQKTKTPRTLLRKRLQFDRRNGKTAEK